MEVQTTIPMETWKREEAFRNLKRYRSPEYAVALAIIHSLAETERCLTSDDVWVEWNKRGLVGRGSCWMGAAFKSAQRAGWIVPNGTIEQSSMPLKHRRNIQLWNSLLFVAMGECSVEPRLEAPVIMGGGD